MGGKGMALVEPEVEVGGEGKPVVVRGGGQGS